MSTTSLTIDIDEKTVTSGKSTWRPADYTFGEKPTFALSFTQVVNGASTDKDITVQTLMAAVGNIDTRPTYGTWRLQIGTNPQDDTNTTATLQFNAGASTLQTAINALTAITNVYGQATVWADEGSLLVTFANAPALTGV